MKKLCFFIFVLIFGFCAKTEKSYEIENKNGIKIIKNYSFLKNDGRCPKLEKEFEIGISDKLLDKKFAEFGTFAVSKIGYIYFFSDKSGIFIFDNKGKFIKNYGKIGQGPEEIAEVSSMYFDGRGRLVICDSGNMKVIYFDSEGNFIKEKKRAGYNSPNFYVLENGNYIKEKSFLEKKTLFIENVLYSKDNKLLVVLSKRKMDNPFTTGDKIPAVYGNMGFMVRNSKIYSFSQQDGYEIRVYNLNGKLIKKIIRVNYKKIKPYERYIKEFESLFKRGFMKEIKNKFYFPKYLPPFHTMTLSDAGYIFVQTYEIDNHSGNYIHEIFNEKGWLLCSIPLPVYSKANSGYQKIKNKRLYTIRYDNSGNQFFTVYKIIGL